MCPRLASNVKPFCYLPSGRSHAAVYHHAWPWDLWCYSSAFWLIATGACLPNGSVRRMFTVFSCTSISLYYVELRLFLFVHQICLPLLIPRWWSSQPTLWVVLSPTCMPCKAMWTCSELLSQLWDIIANVLSSLLHLSQVKGFTLNSNDGPNHQYNRHCWLEQSPKHRGI